MPFNLAETFRRQAALQPAHPAILGPREGDCIGYADLQGEIETLAERFNMAGIDSGMNIGLHYPSGRDYIRPVQEQLRQHHLTGVQPPPCHPCLCRHRALRIDDTRPKWASLADFLAPRHSHHRLPPPRNRQGISPTLRFGPQRNLCHYRAWTFVLGACVGWFYQAKTRC